MKKNSGSLAGVVAAIERQREELGQIVQSAREVDDYDAGFEALRRWKARTVRVLREKVSPDEARRLEAKHKMSFRMGDPMGNLADQANMYDGFLVALLHELVTHPEAIAAAIAESAAAASSVRKDAPDPRSVFIVHGHDEAAKHEVARFLEKLGCVVTILHEQPSGGRTIIARQNVVLELGYFIGKLGRDRVCALVRDEVERPSDYDGVVWVPLDSGAWKQALMQEMKEAGVKFDAGAAFTSRN